MKMYPKAQGWGLCFNIKHGEISLISLFCAKTKLQFWSAEPSSAKISVSCTGCLDRESPQWKGQGGALLEGFRNVGVWLIFLTRSLKCLGEHFNVNNVFCRFYNIFCLFALWYQMKAEMPARQHSQSGADSAKIIIFSKRAQERFCPMQI